MAKAVAEVLAVAGVLDDGASHGVDLASRGAGADSRERLFLRMADQLVDLAGIPCEGAGGERAGAIRAVAVEQRTPVNGQQGVLGDIDRARLGMRQRGMQA